MTAVTKTNVPTGRRDHRSALPRAFRSPVARVVGKRLLMAIPITLGVTILSFWVISLIPGSPAQQLLGLEATPEQVRAMEVQLGLDRPAWERYLDWLGGAVTGDLGTSLVSGQPVSEQIWGRLAVSGELVLLALLCALVVAVPVALLAARRPGGVFDRLTMVVNMVGLSIAPFVLALVLSLVFAVQLGVLPAIGYTPLTESVGANLTSMALPVASLAIPLFCTYTRFLRGDLVDQMQGQDYVVTAQAKGIGSWRVLVRHAFRNSSYGLITVVGLNLGTLIGITVIIESIFALPGIGQLMLQAINTRDMVVVQSVVVVFAVITVLANLAADTLHAVLDPRIRYGDR